VLWTDSIRRLRAEGVERWIEVGPGAVLCGLLRQILPDQRGEKFGEPADLDKLSLTPSATP
jgi:[acyl-carrier-protein] S-malonyltransferase